MISVTHLNNLKSNRIRAVKRLILHILADQ
ncbi:hypothetical protein [Pseudoalteromonas sp. SWXJ133]